MKSGSRSNALLMELLIVILFFMLAATTLVELFGMARQRSQQAEISTAAALEAQNAAEMLYDAEDADACLEKMGFVSGENGWTLEKDGYTLRVTEENEETEAGVLRTMLVAAEYKGDTLMSLPSTRYLEKEGTP